MTIIQKIKNITWFDLPNKLKTILLLIKAEIDILKASPGGQIPTLQQVLDKSNITTKPIVINGASFYAQSGSIEIGEGHTGNTGSNQLAIGHYNGQDNTGNNQIAIGGATGNSNSGLSQIGVGDNAGAGNIGDFQLAMGSGSGSNNTGDYQIALGHSAGADNTFDYVNLIGVNSKATANNQFVLGATSGTKNIRFDCNIADNLLLQFPLTSGRLAIQSPISGTFTTPTSITVTNGIITAIS